MTRTSKLLGVSSGLVLAALSASPAYAAGTVAGSTITNTVSVAYSVSGVSQTPISASNTFTVDRKVVVTVSEPGNATTTVTPGQTSAYSTFQITNSSNATLDFGLAAAQQTGGAGAHSNTDDFDVTNIRIYVDTNGNGVYDGADTLVTYLDELAPDTSKTVFVVADVPLGGATGDVAAVTLTATSREGGTAGTQGVLVTQTSGADTAGMDTVFADGAGATDTARDGAYSAKDDFTVLAAALTVTKTSRVISDPFNGTSNPKAIPGSTIEYCIAAANAAGGAAATSVSITDTLPTTTTYLSTFGILVGGSVTGTTCNADGTSGGAFASGAVTATVPTVAAGSAKTVVFRATVN